LAASDGSDSSSSSSSSEDDGGDGSMDTEWVASEEGAGGSDGSSSNSGGSDGARRPAAADTAAAAANAADPAAEADNNDNDDDDDDEDAPLTQAALVAAAVRRQAHAIRPLVGVRGSTSMYLGVCFNGRPRGNGAVRYGAGPTTTKKLRAWSVHLMPGGRCILRARFHDEEEAARAVDAALVAAGRRPANADLLRKARLLRACGWWWQKKQRAGAGARAAAAAGLPAGVTAAEAEALRPLERSAWGPKI
jgi:hypothetical protein